MSDDCLIGDELISIVSNNRMPIKLSYIGFSWDPNFIKDKILIL